MGGRVTPASAFRFTGETGALRPAGGPRSDRMTGKANGGCLRDWRDSRLEMLKVPVGSGYLEWTQ